MITLFLVLITLVFMGIIPYDPVSEHFHVSNLPGLPQALAPFDQIQEGLAPRFLNTEAIPGPGDRPPLSGSP